MIQADPTSPPEKILEAINAAAINGFNNRYSGFVAQPFGALLVRVVSEAEKAARRMENAAHITAHAIQEASGNAEKLLGLTDNLVQLSKDAAASASIVERLTLNLYRATIVLVVLTSLLLAKEGMNVYENRNQERQDSRQNAETQIIEPLPDQYEALVVE